MGRGALVGIAVLAAAGCRETSGRGLGLPVGDPIAGKSAFVALQCASCHAVQGASDLPKPVVNPPVKMLGGESLDIPTDGELVTSIINPSHQISWSFAVPSTVDGKHTRMADYGEIMTVRQLIDLKAFLRQHYKRGPNL